MRMTRVLLVMLALGGSAHAGDNEISIGPTTRALRTSSANTITDDSLGGGQLGYGRALGMQLLPDLALWAEGSFAWGSADGTLFQSLSTELDTIAFTLGARARYPLHTRIVAHARLDLGTSRAALAIRDDHGHTARDRGWGATTQAAVGIDLHALRRPGLSLGIRFELGYVAASSISLTAEPEKPDDDTLHLQMTAAGLGSLNLSGPVFAVSAMSEF